VSDEVEFEVGFLHGNAVAYSPSTGHIAYEPLRSTAKRLARVGLLVAGDDLLSELDYVDSRPHVAGKIAKKLKKAVNKVKTVAKKVAASKLGKVIKFAAAAVNPAAGATLLALSAGKKMAKAAPIATALAKKKITPKQASTKAKRAGVSPTKVKQAAVALRVQQAANEGNPKAQELVATSHALDAAQSSPAPLSLAAPAYDGGGGGLEDTNPLALQPGEDLPEPEQDDGGEYDQAELEPLDEPAEPFGDEPEYDDGGEYDQTDEYEA
jgi:hypothetical protein